MNYVLKTFAYSFIATKIWHFQFSDTSCIFKQPNKMKSILSQSVFLQNKRKIYFSLDFMKAFFKMLVRN